MNWFKKDMKAKIISILIAIFAWLFVTNAMNPFVSRTVYNIPVTFINEDYLEENNYTLKNTIRNYIDVTIRGRREAVDKVSASDFVASLDFSQITSANNKRLVIPEPECLVKDVTVESYTPSAIDIQLARNKTGTFKVELEPSITMKPGYVLLNTTLSQETIQIWGEETIIDSVGAIKAKLELKDVDRDMTSQVQCNVYNKAGKEIASLSKDLKVNVKVDVAKEVPVALVTRGRLAADYVETLRVIDPVKVLVTGSVEDLEQLKEIKTEQVDIDGLESNFSVSVPLVVPEGVKLINSPAEITVNISVEKLAVRTIEFGSDDINILNANNDGTLVYEILTNRLLLQFKGRQAEVDAIRIADLRPAVDVSGLGEGTHRLKLNIKAPNQAKLVQQVYAEVKISKTPEVVKPPEEPVAP
jgi:YbbR domain-containing protein